MDQTELRTVKREILGKGVKLLRRQGVTPVHLFGRGVESMALQCSTADLRHLLAQAGQTRLLSLKIKGERRPRPVMVREIQRETLRGGLLHVDFYQVKMTEEIRTEVPIAMTGEAPALRLAENMLVQELNTLSIQCLPAEVPDSIPVDVSTLAGPHDALRVRDLTVSEGITVLNDPEVTVVRIAVQRAEEVEAPAAEAVEAQEVAEATPSGEAEAAE